MNRNALFYIPLIVLALLTLAPRAEGATWLQVLQTPRSTYSYDAGTVKRSAAQTTAWVKEELTEVGWQSYLNRLSQDRVDTDRYGYDRLAYTVMLYDFDCANRLFRIRENAEYDRDGGMIASWKNRDTSWSRTVPDSPEENLSRAVCAARKAK